jgi:CheY-like chemotaxis protein
MVGTGSTFLIYLPAVSTEASLPVERPHPAPARKGRVLVMDDESVIRLVAQALLGSLGHDVEAAENGDAAVGLYRRAIAEGRPFDVVILDLTVRGGKGGAETLRELLAIDPCVKAVVSSGYSDDQVIATYLQHGFCSFLKKPYDMQELSRVLDEVMA